MMYASLIPLLAAASIGLAAPAPVAPPDTTPALEAAEATPAEDRGALRLRIDVGARKLYVYEADRRVREFEVAVGKPQHPTPRGSFTVKRVIWNPAWVPPKAAWARDKKPRQPGDPQNPMGRAKIFFLAPDYYIHGTNDDASIGKAASHGCIRMRNDEVVELARLLMEHGGAERPDSWFARVMNRVRTTQDVRLSQPIPVEIRS
jgi:L,D-transpeptidase ErfK/SrfK